VTAVLAVARVVVDAVLVLAAIAAVLSAAARPQGFWTVFWLAAMFVMVTGAVVGVAALQQREQRGDR
jgi:hypothetical protein